MAVHREVLFEGDAVTDAFSSEKNGLIQKYAELGDSEPGFWGWLKKLFRSDKVRRADFIILLFCAQYADRQESQEENERLQAIKSRLGGGKFSRRDWTAFDKALKKYRNAKNSAGRTRIWFEHLDRSLRRIRISAKEEELKALFLHALDLIWADKMIKREEVDFLEILAVGLGLRDDEDFIRDANEIFQYQNNF